MHKKNRLLIVALFFVIFASLFVYIRYFSVHTEPYDTITIPKVIMQTAKEKPKPYVVQKFKSICPNWEYIHFDDEEIIKFFEENPLDEFPRIADKFKSIKNGAHKADLFRYYYIYVKGGVFVDSDAMLEKNLDDVLDDCHFFSVGSKEITPDTIFQGLIGAVPKNEIVFEALMDAYNIDDDKLAKDYHLLIRNLYNIIYKGNTTFEGNFDFKIKLFQERWLDEELKSISEIFDPLTEEIILKHYPMSKEIPMYTI